MDRFKRILRLSVWAVGALIGLFLLGWGGIFIYLGYWHDWGGGSNRQDAIRIAHGIPPDYRESFCWEGNYGPGNPACMIPREAPRLVYCHWWRLENCEVIVMRDAVLQSPEKLGLTIDAVRNPCTYLRRKERFEGSQLEKDCAGQHGEWDMPVVLVFRNKDTEIRLRID